MKYLRQFAARGGDNYTSGFFKIKEICHAVHCCNVMGLLNVANFSQEKKKKGTKKKNVKQMRAFFLSTIFYTFRIYISKDKKQPIIEESSQ